MAMVLEFGFYDENRFRIRELGRLRETTSPVFFSVALSH